MRQFRAYRAVICTLILLLLFACGDAAREQESAASAPPSAAPVPEEIVTETTPRPAEQIELYGESFPADTERIVLTRPVDDLSPLIDALPRFSACRSVELVLSCDPSTCTDGLFIFSEEWSALKQRFSDISFSERLLIGGEPAETRTAYTVPASADALSEVSAAVSLCPALSEIDLSLAAVTSETVKAAEREAPGVRFLWRDAVYGDSASDATALSFYGTQDPDALLAYLDCFPALSEADLLETTLTDAQLQAIADRFPAVAFRRTVLLNGTPTDSFEEELDLSGAQIDSYEAFSDAIGRFPRLTRLVMHDCSLTNEQLASIRDRYPDVKVVWTVRFGRWSVATDAVAFSTMQNGDSTYRMQTKDVQVLRYCRDLLALDLGHNDITDLEWIKDLKHLKVLILAENRKLKDITPIGTLSELMYLELFLTSVEDISPLANLSELLDVNLFFTHIKDITPLLSCGKLERIWLGEKVTAQIGKEGIAKLQDAFPNAEYDLVSAGSTKLGWRDHPRFAAFRRMFEENIPVEPFLP